MGLYVYDKDTKQLKQSDFSSSLRYYGDYNPTALYEKGAVVNIDGEPHICMGSGVWELIGSFKAEPEDKFPKISYSHCKSCGAPVDSYKRRCEYCGVEYAECM